MTAGWLRSREANARAPFHHQEMKGGIGESSGLAAL